jgi:hypothetical protein
MAIRLASLLVGVFVMASMAAGPALALTAKDCAKMKPKEKDECVRSLDTAGKSGTQPARPADPAGPGPATPAVPAVPGKGKGR